MLAGTRPIPQGAIWVDCEVYDRDHDWYLQLSWGDHSWWGCHRCPVATRTAGDEPQPRLRAS